MVVICLGCEATNPPPPKQGNDQKEDSRVLGPLETQDPNAPQAVDARQLRQLAIAMMTYADQDRRGRMVPEGTESWRVALGRETQAYEPNQLRDDTDKTRLLLVTGPGTLFDSENPHRGTRRIIEQAPRAASTIPLVIVVGQDRAVSVDEASDFVFDPSNPKAGLGDVDDPILVVMADGSVRQFPKSISPTAFTVLCQIEPQIEEAKFAEVKAELERLGLPSQLPRRTSRSKPNLE